MCKRWFYGMLLWIVAASLLAGCGVRASPGRDDRSGRDHRAPTSGTPTPPALATLIPTVADLPTETQRIQTIRQIQTTPSQPEATGPCGDLPLVITKVVGPPVSVQPANILLQLAWEGGFTRQEFALGGRVPEFTLLSDGRAFYQVPDDPLLFDRGQVMAVHLAPAERQELVRRVLDLGFDRLGSYPDSCRPLPGGMCECVEDAGTSIVRLRLASGELREVRNYHTFANDPDALAAIRALLEGYQHPKAEPYIPEKAALFIQAVASDDPTVKGWPLDPAWLAGASAVQCQRALSGSDLEALLSVTGRNTGDFQFRAGGRVYMVYLVPWLPGVDYTDFIASSGQACLPPDDSPGPGAGPAWNVSYEGQFGGRSTAMAVRDNRAYLGVGPRVVILDVSRPARPAVLGQTLPLPGLVHGLATGVDRVYVAGDAAGLIVIGVSDPAHPVQIGLLDTPGRALGVTVGGGRAYVADGEAGLRVMDIYRPARPVELGFYDTPGNAYGVAVEGRYTYVADGVAGLRVVDVADPSRPREVGFYDTPGEARAVAVARGYAYVADRDGGLRVVDVFEPDHPVEVGFYDTPDMATSVAVRDDIPMARYAYVANGAMAAGLLVVDVTDPAHPQPAGSTTESSSTVVVSGRYAYAADWEKGLRIVDISDPYQPRQVGFYHTSGSAVGVAVAGDRAYLPAWGAGLHIVDVSDPAHVVEIGSVEGQGWYKHAAVFEYYAYGACGWGGLRVVDLADPAHPAEVGVYITPGHAEDVALWSTDDPPGLYAAVANALEGLRVVDISDPVHPVEIGACDTPGQAFGVAVLGGYAYVADDEAGLRVLSLADPRHPVELGFYDTPMNAFGVAVASDPLPSDQSRRSGRTYAYVADGGSGLRIVDVSDPAHPFEVGSWGTPGPAISVVIRDATPMARYAYVAAGDGGLRVVDVSNPASPRQVGYYDTPGWAQEVALAGDWIYLADDAGGLLILRFGIRD